MSKSILLFLCFLQFGCNYNLSKANLKFSEGLSALDQIPAGTVVSYSVIANSLMPKCLECHSNSGGNDGGINLETYENIAANLGIIKDEVQSNRMPKNRAKLSAKEKDVLVTWINAGAPINGQIAIEPKPTPTPTPAPGPTTPTTPTPPDVQFITYEMVNTQVIQPRCIKCHSGVTDNPKKINLETYENVLAAANVIESEIQSGSMPRPKNKPLEPAQKDLILKWLANGAPKTAPEVEFISYEMVNTKVIQPRCLKCHSEAGGNRGKVNLETYENVVASIKDIEADIQDGSMPRPKNQPLEAEQKALILKWIAKGAPKTN